MFGHEEGGRILVDKLVIPKQEGRSDSWTASDDAQIGAFSEGNKNLTLYETIHTHPGFKLNPLIVDPHQQYKIQREQLSAIAIIVAPERNENPILTLSRFGMEQLGRKVRR